MRLDELQVGYYYERRYGSKSTEVILVRSVGTTGVHGDVLRMGNRVGFQVNGTFSRNAEYHVASSNSVNRLDQARTDNAQLVRIYEPEFGRSPGWIPKKKGRAKKVKPTKDNYLIIN